MTSIESVVKEMEAEMENHFSESKTTVNEYNKGLHSGIYSYIGSLLPKLKSISPQGASEGISKIREVMNWISQCVDEDHDLEVSEIKMIWNDLSDAISLIESTPHSSEGMAEALAKFFAKECKVGDPLLSIIDSIYDDWKLVYDKLRIETSFSEAAIQANKFVIEKFASLSSPGSGWVKVEDGLPEIPPPYFENGLKLTPLGCRVIVYDSVSKEVYEANYYDGHFDDNNPDITHWRPLPAPPGE